VTDVLLKSLTDRHDVNVIGFYVGSSPYDLKTVVQSCYGFDSNEIKDTIKQIKREKCLVVENHRGYTEFYIIEGGKNLDIESSDLDIEEGASNAKLTTAFKKHCKGKLKNRVILSRFVDLIS
jgi:hypothetical protein